MSTENPDDFCVCGARRKAHLAPFSGCGDFEPFEGPPGDVCAVCRGDGYGGEGPVSPCDACGGSGKKKEDAAREWFLARPDRDLSRAVDALRGSRFKPELAVHGSAEPASLAGILGTHGPADLAEATDILKSEGLEEHLGLAIRIAEALAKTRVAAHAEGPIVSPVLAPPCGPDFILRAIQLLDAGLAANTPHPLRAYVEQARAVLAGGGK